MIQLQLSSPFWEDQSSLTSDGEDEDAMIEICVNALQAAGYEIRVRDEEGDLIPWEDL